ncbi:MAG: SPOR domain-containing protein [Paracoccaceae bacterium]|nr:SPOR domain-containing protein [Paracoccaceae bacterium]
MSKGVLRSGIIAVAVVGLTACEEMEGLNGPPISEEVVASEARTEVRDVERGDIFSATELALWDGRPSLGGVWVAHPDVSDPEKVRIKNLASGTTITGALFRRERDNPGPRIQLSSDAAAALGVLAGQPTELEVIVLRTEEIVIEPAPLPIADDLENAEEASEDDGEIALASDEAALNEAEEGVAIPVVASVGVAVDPEPRQPGFWRRFRDSFRNKPAEESEAAALAATAPPVSDASAPEVETQPLDTIAVAAAAIDEAEAETPAETSAAPDVPGVRNPFIQVGLFSQIANANAAAASLRQGGIVPTVSEGSNDRGPFWRVLVGPVTSAGEQTELMAQVRSLGYDDAFFTPN